MRRRPLLGLFGAMALVPAARAQGGGPVPVITGFYQSLEKVMRAGTGTPFRARYDMLAPAVDQAFDLATILSVSVGARWSSLDAGVQAGLSEMFRVYSIASYVANFDRFDGERFEVSAETRPIGADQVVQTRIVPKTGTGGIRLDFLMREGDKGWRVVDVLADGTISRVAVQRSDFRAILGRDMNTAALLESLRRKVADLSGGALS
jgi:phospholipid transport system substrate-binding protein